MSKRTMIAGIVALGLGAAGAVHAQSTPAAPSTSPPERMNGSTTLNNPATSTTPQPGSPAALSTPSAATAPTAPALGTPGDVTPGTSGATHSSATSPTPPISGANSFTEGQARARMQDSGFAQVSDLKLDNQGIWRGKAMRDGKNVTVALDFKGNVVAQ